MAGGTAAGGGTAAPGCGAAGARLADTNFALVRRLPRKEREAIQAFYALGAFKAV
jgi:hypothetical protein